MKKLSLTFDDGPNGKCTLALLDVLGKHQIPATFFVIGERYFIDADLAEKIELAGHEVGNHTEHHRVLTGLSWLDIHKEICMWGNYFRPPEGKYDDGVIQYLNSALWDIQLVMWDIDGFDWTLKTADEICAVVDEQIGDGGIILLHDGDSTKPDGDRWATVEATDRIITKYKEQGYEFVSLSEMKLPGVPRKVAL